MKAIRGGWVRASRGLSRDVAVHRLLSNRESRRAMLRGPRRRPTSTATSVSGRVLSRTVRGAVRRHLAAAVTPAAILRVLLLCSRRDLNPHTLRCRNLNPVGVYRDATRCSEKRISPGCWLHLAAVRYTRWTIQRRFRPPRHHPTSHRNWRTQPPGSKCRGVLAPVWLARQPTRKPVWRRPDGKGRQSEEMSRDPAV